MGIAHRPILQTPPDASARCHVATTPDRARYCVEQASCPFSPPGAVRRLAAGPTSGAGVLAVAGRAVGRNGPGGLSVHVALAARPRGRGRNEARHDGERERLVEPSLTRLGDERRRSPARSAPPHWRATRATAPDCPPAGGWDCIRGTDGWRSPPWLGGAGDRSRDDFAWPRAPANGLARTAGSPGIIRAPVEMADWAYARAAESRGVAPAPVRVRLPDRFTILSRSRCLPPAPPPSEPRAPRPAPSATSPGSRSLRFVGAPLAVMPAGASPRGCIRRASARRAGPKSLVRPP